MKKHNLIIGGLFLSLFGCTSVDEPVQIPETNHEINESEKNSAYLSYDEAKDIAKLLWRSHDDIEVQEKNSRAIYNIDLLRDEFNSPILYVINSLDEGWILISATKKYHPVLAYSKDPNSYFQLDYISPGISFWLDEIKNAIKNVDEQNSEIRQQIEIEWMSIENELISPLANDIPGGSSTEAVLCRNRLKELNETYYSIGWQFTTISSINISLPDYIYQYAQELGTKEYTIVGIRDESQITYVDPLLTTAWSQRNGFNDLCPNKYPAGCVPVAMAQIMKFHKFPSNFEWGQMDDLIPTYATQYLISEIGKTINVKYGSDESSASLDDAMKGFQNYGYYTILQDHNNYDVVKELSVNKRPVLMSGKTGLLGNGHVWVCDGVNQHFSEYSYYVEYLKNGIYDNCGETLIENPGHIGGTSYTTFHMNWGWGADYIGWYIDTNAPNDQNYNYDRKNIYISLN